MSRLTTQLEDALAVDWDLGISRQALARFKKGKLTAPQAQLLIVEGIQSARSLLAEAEKFAGLLTDLPTASP